MAQKYYYIVSEVSVESNLPIISYVCTTIEKAKALLQKKFDVQVFGAKLTGTPMPFNTLDNDYFRYVDSEGNKYEYKITRAFRG